MTVPIIDRKILDWLQAHHTAVLDGWMPALAAITGARAWVVAAALVAFVLLFRGRRAEALWLFGGACIGSLLARLIKPLVHRARPLSGLTLHDASFPSGHATSSVAFLGLLSFLIHRRNPGLAKVFWWAAACLVILIGFNRVYLAAHWPTDVLGGWAIGGTFAYLWCRQFPP